MLPVGIERKKIIDKGRTLSSSTHIHLHKSVPGEKTNLPSCRYKRLFIGIELLFFPHAHQKPGHFLSQVPLAQAHSELEDQKKTKLET
jgi:hypothetical protein